MTEKKKKGFKMPHLLFMMIGLIVIMSLLTYVIPAGEFATREDGTLNPNEFNYQGYQTPVPLWRAFMLMLDGLRNSSLITWLVLVSGAAIQVYLDTEAIDDLLNWSLAKLQDKGANVLIPVMFTLMVYLGAFGGSDAMIAVVPIGVMFAKKLRLDPVVAMGVTTFATLLGFGTGPTKQMIAQTMLGVPIYSGFGVRFISMNIFLIIGLAYLMWYVKRIQADPTKSVVGHTDWLESGGVSDEVLKAAELHPKTVIVLILFLAQYLIVVWYTMAGYKDPYHFQILVFVAMPIIGGLVHGFTLDEIGNSFAKGLASMAFVAFVIGMAGVVSLVMAEGKIVHTIVYVITRPLLVVGIELSSVLMLLVIALINPIIPSASAKIAILVPIIAPIGEAIGLHPQLTVQAFQYGDGFTNIISPLLGWTVGSTVMAGLDFDKWLKWSLPITIFMVLVSCVIMYILTAMGWTGL